MTTLAAETPQLPRKATDKIIQAALSPEEYKQFIAIKEKKDWSEKKLTEKIIRLFLAEVKNKPSRLNDL